MSRVPGGDIRGVAIRGVRLACASQRPPAIVPRERLRGAVHPCERQPRPASAPRRRPRPSSEPRRGGSSRRRPGPWCRSRRLHRHHRIGQQAHRPPSIATADQGHLVAGHERREVRGREVRPEVRHGPAVLGQELLSRQASPIMCCSPSTPARTARGPTRPSMPRSGRRRSSVRRSVREARCSSAIDQRPEGRASARPRGAWPPGGGRRRPRRDDSSMACRRVQAASSSSPSARRPARSSGDGDADGTSAAAAGSTGGSRNGTSSLTRRTLSAFGRASPAPNPYDALTRRPVHPRGAR